MDASKENARKAVEHLDRGVNGILSDEAVRFIREFLEAAQRKLPSQASYDRQRQKKAKK